MSDERRFPEAGSEVPGGIPEVPGGDPTDPAGRWLTMAEAAEVLGMAERSARDWVRRHDLPVSVGRPTRVAEARLLAAMAGEHRAPRRLPEAPPEVPGGGEPIEATYQVVGDTSQVALVPLQTMVEELRGLADQLAELARRNEGLALEVGGLRAEVAGHRAQLTARDQVIVSKDEVLASQRETIAELRHRADVAEAADAFHEPVVAELRYRLTEQERTLAELRHRADLAEQEAATLRAQLSPPVVAQDEPQGDRGTPEASTPEQAAGAGLWGRVRRWWQGEG